MGVFDAQVRAPLRQEKLLRLGQRGRHGLHAARRQRPWRLAILVLVAVAVVMIVTVIIVIVRIAAVAAPAAAAAARALPARHRVVDAEPSVEPRVTVIVIAGNSAVVVELPTRSLMFAHGSALATGAVLHTLPSTSCPEDAWLQVLSRVRRRNLRSACTAL